MQQAVGDGLIFLKGYIDAQMTTNAEYTKRDATPKSLQLMTKEESELVEKLKDCKVRRKCNGVWEVRYRRNGYDKSFSSKVLKIAIRKAGEFIRQENARRKATPKQSQKETKTKFGKFAMLYMETVKQPYVVAETYYQYLNRLKNHILPELGEKDIREIKPIDIQEIFNRLKENGHGRTAEDVYVLLNQIFEYAEANGIIAGNPVRAVKKEKHYRTTGNAFSIEFERQLLAALAGTKYEPFVIIALYTGVRPCELHTVKLDGSFIVAENKKRKNHKTEYKRIPITPMLAPYMVRFDFDALPYISTDELSRRVKEISNGHYTLKDTRHTFVTRCKACGVPNDIVAAWAGHSLSSNMTATVYTHFDDKTFIKYGKKVKYRLEE